MGISKSPMRLIDHFKGIIITSCISCIKPALFFSLCALIYLARLKLKMLISLCFIVSKLLSY
jgi:hypothetical protein